MMNARDEARKKGVPEVDIARMCWRCGNYGEEQNTVQAPTGNGKITGYVCANELCVNFGTGWIKQVDRNGNLANRMGERNTQATEFQKGQAERLTRMGSSLVDDIKRDAEESVKPQEPR